MEVSIACIVEGHSEVESVPILIRRIAQRLSPTMAVVIPTPIRVSRSKLNKAGELERAIELAAGKACAGGRVLILVDSDDECPAVTGPEFLKRARAARHDVPISVVLAERAFTNTSD